MTRLRQFVATIGIVFTVSIVASWLIAWVNGFAFRVVLVNFNEVTTSFVVGGWIVFSLIEWGWEKS